MEPRFLEHLRASLPFLRPSAPPAPPPQPAGDPGAADRQCATDKSTIPRMPPVQPRAAGSLRFRAVAALSSGLHRVFGCRAIGFERLGIPRGMTLQQVLDTGVNLTGVSLAQLKDTGVKLTGASLAQLKDMGGNVTGVSMPQLQDTGVNLTGVSLAQLKDLGVDLHGARLSHALAAGLAVQDQP